jgi:FkbM family methyltransferase
MKTRDKIALAKVAYTAVHAARMCVGKGDNCEVERDGIRFDLNLAQGIDFSIYLRGHFEPATARALAREIKPGSTVLDIGANIGAHTLHMARLVGDHGRVFAFEPTDYAFAKLTRNIELNPSLAPRIKPAQFFLAPADGERPPEAIYSAWPLKVDGEDIHERHRGSLKSASGASQRALDSFLSEAGNPTIALIKLDVDGFECDVLAGAGEMMRRDRPTFVMELAPYIMEERGIPMERLLSYFKPHGYSFFDEGSGERLPDDEKELLATIDPGSSRNVIARTTARSSVLPKRTTS